MTKIARGWTAVVLAALGALAAAPGWAQAGDSQVFADRIASAHGLAAWRGKGALAGDLEVVFGGTTMLAGKLLFTPSMSASRLEMGNGTVLVFDGRDAWVSPASAQVPMARFHLLSWPYFAALPFKLGDPGTKLEPLGERQLLGKSYPAARLTFAPGVGDSPDDWYILYMDPANGRLHAVAYIVTYGGRSREEAEKEAHVLVYEDFRPVDGATLATTWTFYNWDAERGLHGDSIGRVTLANPRFVEPADGAFAAPAGGRKDELPGR